MTWFLWRQLCLPPNHPLYWRTRRAICDSFDTALMVWLVLIVYAGVGIALAIFFGQTNPSALMLPLIGLTLFNSSIYAVVWAVRISRTISRERENGVYDLLAALPGGALGLHRIIAAAVLHADDALMLTTTLRRITIGLTLVIFALLLLLVTTQVASFNPVQFLRLLLDALAVLLASYLDHIQSAILASQIGMLVPARGRTRFDTRLWPALIFLLAQILMVAALVLMALIAVPAVTDALMPLPWAAELSPPVVLLILFCLIREGVLLLTWGILHHHLR